MHCHHFTKKTSLNYNFQLHDLIGCQFMYQKVSFDDQRLLCHYRIKSTGLVCSVVPVSVDVGTVLVVNA